MAPAIRPAVQLLAAERGGDRGDARLVEGERQRAVRQHVGQVLGRDCWVKLPEICALPPVSAWLHRRVGDDLAVQDDARTGSAGPGSWRGWPVTSANFLLPLDVNSMVTSQPAAPCGVEDGLGLLDVRAVDLGRAEDVLLPLTLRVLAAGRPWARPGWTPSPVAARTAFVGAVQRRELRLERRGRRVGGRARRGRRARRPLDGLPLGRRGRVGLQGVGDRRGPARWRWPTGWASREDDEVAFVAGLPRPTARAAGRARASAWGWASRRRPGPQGQNRPEVELGGGADLLPGLLGVRALGDVDDDVVAIPGSEPRPRRRQDR